MLRSMINIRHCSTASQPAKNRQIPQKLQAKLVKSVKNKNSFPSIESSLSLARNLAQIQVTVDHFSKILLTNYKFGSAVNSKLQKLFDDKEDIEELVNLLKSLKNESKGSDIQVSTGILYFNGLYRLLEKIESRAKDNLKPLEFEDPDLIYGQWLAYYLHEKDQFANEILSKNIDSISSKIVFDLKSYASEYSNKTVALPASIPRIFNPGDIHFCDRLLQEDKFSPSIIHQILCMKSTALWNAGNYSNSLENLTSVLQFWMENFHDADTRYWIGKYAIPTLVSMLKTICEHNMKPAVQYLEVILEKLDQTVPIVPYVLVIIMTESKHFDEKSKEISAKYPMIQKLKDDKFEKSIKQIGNVDSSILDRQLQRFLNGIDLSHFQISAEEEILNEKVEMSPQLLQDTIDLTVLEMIKADQLEDAIEFINQETVAPTKDVISAFAQVILPKDNAMEMIESLRNALSIESKAYEFICLVEVKQKSQNIYVQWKEDQLKAKALRQMLHLYNQLIENEYQVSDDLVDIFLRKILLYLKFFLEECLSNHEIIDAKECLKIAKNSSDMLFRAYNHHGLLALYWETFAFSTDYEDQSKADALFQEYPQLPRHLDYDHLLTKAKSNEVLLRKLMEISLAFDLEDYQKQLAFEAMLIFSSKRGDFKTAKSTVQSAQNLGIALGAEAMQEYLLLSTAKPAGFFDFIFRSNKEQK